jgi:hypothetical protein
LRTGGHDRAAFVAEYEEAGPLAVPRVKVVLDISVKGQRCGRRESGIDKAAFALADHDGFDAFGVYYCAAPADGHGGRAFRQDIYAYLRISIDADGGNR